LRKSNDNPSICSYVKIKLVTEDVTFAIVNDKNETLNANGQVLDSSGNILNNGEVYYEKIYPNDICLYD
jgi:hypothetical protein